MLFSRSVSLFFFGVRRRDGFNRFCKWTAVECQTLRTFFLFPDAVEYIGVINTIMQNDLIDAKQEPMNKENVLILASIGSPYQALGGPYL